MNSRTNIHISEEARAILSALGAAVTGKPSMAAGLAELVARVTEGITTHPTQPGKPKATPYRAAWTNADGENEETEFAYPDRPSATAAAVLLRYEEARARALAQPEPEQISPDEDHGLTLRATIDARNFGANVEMVQP